MNADRTPVSELGPGGLRGFLCVFVRICACGTLAEQPQFRGSGWINFSICL